MSCGLPRSYRRWRRRRISLCHFDISKLHCTLLTLKKGTYPLWVGLSFTHTHTSISYSQYLRWSLAKCFSPAGLNDNNDWVKIDKKTRGIVAAFAASIPFQNLNQKLHIRFLYEILFKRLLQWWPLNIVSLGGNGNYKFGTGSSFGNDVYRRIWSYIPVDPYGIAIVEGSFMVRAVKRLYLGWNFDSVWNCIPYL